MIFFATNFLSKEVYFQLVCIIFWTYTCSIFNVFIGPVSHFVHVVVSQKKYDKAQLNLLYCIFDFLESS